jgi:hypothetical protein
MNDFAAAIGHESTEGSCGDSSKKGMPGSDRSIPHFLQRFDCIFVISVSSRGSAFYLL